MINVMKIMLLIILCICLINYGIDYIFYMKDRYCRYHIGKWRMDEWTKAVEKMAFRWSKKPPTVRMTDNNRYILLDMVNGKYKSATIQSWQKAALILGLCESANVESRNRARESIEACFDNTGMWKEKPTRVDGGLLSYAALRTVDDPLRIRLAMDYFLEIVEKSINDQGLVFYTDRTTSTHIYVDVLGLTVPFLAAYAKYYGISEYEELAFKQLREFHDNGLYAGTNLPVHAYDSAEGLPLGVYGWGRGTGWYVLGLIESLELFTNSEYRTIVKGWIYNSAEEYMTYQHADGGFGSILQSRLTYDSSVTALMAYFYARASIEFHSEAYYHVSERCLSKLLKCTRITGAIDWCQGDTKEIGVFSQVYDIMPFAQGMTLWALGVMHRTPSNALPKE